MGITSNCAITAPTRVLDTSKALLASAKPRGGMAANASVAAAKFGREFDYWGRADALRERIVALLAAGDVFHGAFALTIAEGSL